MSLGANPANGVTDNTSGATGRSCAPDRANPTWPHCILDFLRYAANADPLDRRRQV